MLAVEAGGGGRMGWVLLRRIRTIAPVDGKTELATSC